MQQVADRPRVDSRIRMAVTLVLTVFVIGAIVTAPQADADRAMAIGRQIRCPVCSGESIADSGTTIAKDMMALVQQRIDEGLSDEQVIQSVLAGYGSDAQRLDPPFSVRTAVLWLIPASVLVVGAVVAVGRRRTSAGEQS